MSEDIAVVFDVAGTILRMYRVAKDIRRCLLLENVVTCELITAKRGLALIVPQIDPASVAAFDPNEPIASLIAGIEDRVEISCSSSPITRDAALSILRSSRARVSDLQEANSAVKARCPDKYQTTGMIIDEDLREVTFALSTGGTPFPGLSEVLSDLECLGADVYVASGDSMRSLTSLEDYGIDLNRVCAVATPGRKQQLVMRLKERYKRVVMVGDGLNDLHALQAADLGVLTVQQDTRPALNLLQAADEIITDLRELPEILKSRCMVPT